MFFNENKRIRLHNNRFQFSEDWVGTQNMATVSLFRGTNMAAVTTCENRELNYGYEMK